jgi:hypothetical protein
MSPQMSASVLLLPRGQSRGLLAKGANTASMQRLGLAVDEYEAPNSKASGGESGADVVVVGNGCRTLRRRITSPCFERPSTGTRQSDEATN